MDARVLGRYRIYLDSYLITMNIPHDLQAHVLHPTLCVTADHTTARVYLAGGDAIEEIDALSEPRERVEHDGQSSADGIRTADPSADADDLPRLTRFATHIAEHADALIDARGIMHVHLVMPADLLHLVEHHFSQQTSSRVRTRTALSLMHEDPVTILRRIFAS
jgi:hypothetical protein